MTDENKKTFLEELRSLDEPIKRRALVIGSAVLMVAVVFVWFAYFNDIVIGGQEQAQAVNATANTPAAAPVQTPTSQTQTANAAAVAAPSLWQNIENGFGDIAHMFQAPRQYNIQPSSTTQE
jgi:hypothetical protein